MQQCPSCGYSNPAGEALCAQCGRPLAAEGATALPPPPVAATPMGSAIIPPPLPTPFVPEPLPPGSIPIGVPYGVPIPLHPQEPRGRSTSFFFLGLGLGIVAAILSIYGVSTLSSAQFGYGSGGLWYLGCIPAVAALVGMIVCLSIRKVRFIGYGLLAVIVGSPVIFAVGCILILSGSGLFHR